MNTTTWPRPLRLHRPWPLRALHAAGALLGRTARSLLDAWQRWREDRIARRAIDSALDLPEHDLCDMGVPLWLQEMARARREARRFDDDLERLRSRLASRGYY